ncbi:MAG: hypothetical protein A2236_00340 [Bacteroidetes bacterium RIFOXYA2_FULL_33_7]|nr:MAG: hypothetical protein A2236_00340 [Bacteroidetes bacterium RIFOXYA2_FULL_33_7]
MRIRIEVIFIIFSLFSIVAEAQQQGIPFIQNYPPEKYKGYSQNWTAEQDNRGVMYFGNGKGILEYNGKTWRRFYTDNGSTILSLGKDNKGRIYVGGENEIGYIAADSMGLTRFYDLTYLIPEKHKGFTYVWHVYTSSNGIYFVTPEKIIRIKNKTVRVYYPKSSFFTAFMVDNQFFVQDFDLGLLIEDNDTLNLPPKGNSFGDLRGIFPYDNNHLLFVTRERGCFLFDHKNPAQHFETQAESLLRDLQFYKGIMLKDSTYAFATLAGGIILIDKKGNIKNVVSEQSGLLGNNVYALFEDQQGGVWSMLGNGLSRVDFSSPLTQFDKRTGLAGIVQDIELIDSVLYAAVIGGVYRFKNAEFKNMSFEPAKFELVTGFNEQYYGMTKVNNEILVVGAGGVYSWDGDKKNHVFYNKNEMCVEASVFHKNTAFVGGSGLLYAIVKENGKWNWHKIYEGGIEDVYYIAEQDSNTIWTSTVNSGIMRFEIINSKTFEATLAYYDSTKGIPTGITEITNINGEIIVGTRKGLKKYDNKTDCFIPATDFANTLHNGQKNTYVISFDKQQRLWALQGKTVGYSYQTSDSAIWFDYPFRKMNVNDIYRIFSTENACWIGGTDGIFHYDETKKTVAQDSLFAIITSISALKDTIFYGAYYDDSMYVSYAQPLKLINEFEYYHNAFIFDFALASFNNEELNMFKFYLYGYDSEWSDWTYENKKEFTNLPEGEYIFKVKGLDVYGNESKIAEYKFTILPPWYRTYWAYALYIIGFSLTLYVAMRLNSYRLRVANLKLESIVTQRTKELRQRNEEIMQQKEEISAQRDEIEAQRDQVLRQNESILQQNEEIEAQRDEIEAQRDMIVEQKQEIVDSINYASLIQQAILPPVSIISKVYSDNFILFKPKDIVSGDFYWFFEKDNKTIVAAVDCTGHGVPGGFMSMLGIAFLTEIVSNNSISNAANLLNDLRNLVIKSLHQTDASGSSKDGMDIALCVYDKEQKVIHFAGANNPIYIVKKEKRKVKNEENTKLDELSTFNFQLHEIKGDKMPIGIHYSENAEFTNHIINVESGDRFYAFSDGFADQFGGEKGKKFKYHNLKELLLKSSNKTMTEQKEILDKTLVDWMSYHNDAGMVHEQVDDVLIVGFEI